MVWVVVAVFLLIGSRELLFGRATSRRSATSSPFLGPAARCCSRGSAATRPSVSARSRPAPPASACSAASGYVFLGAVGRAAQGADPRAACPVGAVGMWRLTKPIGSRRARIVATRRLRDPSRCRLQRHGRGPVGRPGRCTRLVPWMLSQLAKAAGRRPVRRPSAAAPARACASGRSLHRVVAVGVITALAAMVEPADRAGRGRRVALVALVVGGLLVGPGRRGAAGCWSSGVGGPSSPWCCSCRGALGFAADGWAAVVGVSSTSGYGLGLGRPAALRDRPVRAAASLGWAFLLAAAPAAADRPSLAARRGPSGRGCWPSPASGCSCSPPPRAGCRAGCPRRRCCSPPAAVGLALSAGLGMAAFEVDLPDYHFGWRQIVSLLAGAAFVLGAAAGRRRRRRRALGPAPRRLHRLAVVPRHRGRRGAVPRAVGRRRRRWCRRQLGARRAREQADGSAFAFATSDSGTPNIGDQLARPIRRRHRRAAPGGGRGRDRRHEPSRCAARPDGRALHRGAARARPGAVLRPRRQLRAERPRRRPRRPARPRLGHGEPRRRGSTGTLRGVPTRALLPAGTEP